MRLKIIVIANNYGFILIRFLKTKTLITIFLNAFIIKGSTHLESTKKEVLPFGKTSYKFIIYKLLFFPKTTSEIPSASES